MVEPVKEPKPKPRRPALRFAGWIFAALLAYVIAGYAIVKWVPPAHQVRQGFSGKPYRYLIDVTFSRDDEKRAVIYVLGPGDRDVAWDVVQANIANPGMKVLRSVGVEFVEPVGVWPVRWYVSYGWVFQQGPVGAWRVASSEEKAAHIGMTHAKPDILDAAAKAKERAEAH